MPEDNKPSFSHPSEDIMRQLIRHVEKYGVKYGNATGAFLVKDDEIVAKAVTTVDKDNDPTAHAEMKVIRSYARESKTTDLSDCYLYVTSEPCPMCASAIVWANLGGVVHGWGGAKFNDLLNIPASHIFSAKKDLEVHPHFLEEETKNLNLRTKDFHVHSFIKQNNRSIIQNNTNK